MTAVAEPPKSAAPHAPTQTHAEVTRDVLATLQTPGRGYYMALFGAIAAFLIGLFTFVMLLKDGLGLAGYQPPVMWNVYITTFVFWIGIGHAGTLISAILFLFRSPWRTVVYRSTEAMTVSRSQGKRVRRSITSTDTPSSFSICSAASSAFHTVAA